MYRIDPDSSKPLYLQLYEALREEILHERKVGDRMPSIRSIVQQYRLSKTTVERAFAQLYAEGYIESRPKSGYYVAGMHQEASGYVTRGRGESEPETSWRFDFFPARLHRKEFPKRVWKRLQNRVIDSEDLDMGNYHEGQGEQGLREAIARYLTDSRGVVCNADQILVTHGFADSMELLARLLREDHREYGMESPGYHMARKVFASAGYRVEEIPVDKGGIDLQALRASKATVVYITPSHHYPTGAVMPISRRLELISLMAARGGYIIEDDYDSELKYDTRPIPSLQGLDRHDCVIYLGTFAKSLSPALRVGYAVLPYPLLERYRRSYDRFFPRVSLLTQKCLELFLSEGHYARHLRRIRTLQRKKHDRMKELFAQKLGATYTILAEGGGLAILIMPSVPFDMERLRRRAREERIRLYFARERSGGDFEAIRMGFGGFALEELEEAMEAFAGIWRECLLTKEP